MFKKINIASNSHVAVLICTIGLLTGCNRVSTVPEKTYPAGATVEIGELVYNINGQQWLTSLEGERGPRVPNHKFLVLTVSITSKKGERSSIPLMTLIDGTGQHHLELDNGEGVSNWLGLIRNVEPNGSEGGMVLFDVPSGKAPYKVRVSSGGDVDKEVTALIEVPDEKATQSRPVPAPDSGQ